SFDEATFAVLAGPDLVPELETLARAGILIAEQGSPARHSFVHALTRHAIYTNLLPSQRAQLHEQAARALEVTPLPDVEEIAHHYSASRNDRKAVEYLLRAGERAFESFANEAALHHLTAGLERVAALPESDRSQWRERYLARQGELLERMARHGDARTALEASLREGGQEPLERARLLRLVAQTHRLESDFAAA